MKYKPRALVLFSGGLDSILAVKVLELQDIEVTGVCFTSNFFDSKKAEQIAAQNKIKIMVIDIGQDVLGLVKNPPNGYGKNMNPCVDCHSLMVKKAGELMMDGNYDFIATGEVLGQRPFSQNKEALERVITLSGFEILRPLSAKLLPTTKIEKDGLVNRGRLLDIKGRGRDRQIGLTKIFKVEDFPSPAGGCLLTDPAFSERLIRMLDYWPDCDVSDVELLKFGRVYWFSCGEEKDKKVLVLIGRKDADNEQLKKLSQKKDVIIGLEDVSGPTSLIRCKDNKFNVVSEKKEIDIPNNLSLAELNMSDGKTHEEIVDMTLLLTGYFAVKARGEKVKVELNFIN